MSIRSLARDLGISPTRVAQLIRRGMPTDPEQAKAWRMAYVTPPNTARSSVIAMHEAASEGDELEDLGATLVRLRHVERTTAAALEDLLRAGKVAEVAALRREHVAVIKAIYDAESKRIKIDEARGKLISVDRALSMISEALAAPIILLRRLPELGHDEAERKRLEVFLNAVLNEIRDGAQRGLERSASVKHAVGSR